MHSFKQGEIMLEWCKVTQILNLLIFCDNHIEEILQNLGGRDGSGSARRIDGFFCYFYISSC